MQEDEIIIVISATLGLIFTLFWMTVAWRAMRAHEKLAKSVEQIARQKYVSDLL